jgi:hypothetical protein
LGLHTLQEILQEKEAIAHTMQEHLDAATHAWFVFLNSKFSLDFYDLNFC